MRNNHRKIKIQYLAPVAAGISAVLRFSHHQTLDGVLWLVIAALFLIAALRSRDGIAGPAAKEKGEGT